MSTSMRDQYLSALGITQWVRADLLNADDAPIPIPSPWISTERHSRFAFIVEDIREGARATDAQIELLTKIIAALGQTLDNTTLITANTLHPHELPTSDAQYTIVLGYPSLKGHTSFYFAPTLEQLMTDVQAKRALWMAMKEMMGTHV